MEQTEQEYEGLRSIKFVRKFMDTKVYKDLVAFYNRPNVKFVLFLYLIGFCIFAYTLAYNYFTIPVSGDFTIQQIPFYYNGYDDWWYYFKTGEFVFWDENTNLGANNIGANTFYYLWNIFYLPVLLVPRAFVPQAQALMIITKFVLAGVAMKKLLSAFNITLETKELVSIAYAFSGWAFFYLWFNHFLEIAVLFPLFIYGIELVVQKRKPTFLILMIFLSAMTNYFFLIMFCFCGVIYAAFRYFQLFKGYSNKERRDVILLGISSFSIGLIMSLCVLFPAFSVVINSSRVTGSTSSPTYSTILVESINGIVNSLKVGDYSLVMNNIKGFFDNLLFFDTSNTKRTYLYPLVNFFFPTVSCYDSLLFNNNGYDNTLCSLFVYTPLMLMLIPSLLNSFKERKISHIVGFIGMLVLIFTPFAYYCFSGFTKVCYGRWQLFPVVVMMIYIAINYDKKNQMKKWYLDVSFVICFGMELLLFEVAKQMQGTTGVKDLVADSELIVYAQLIYVMILYIYMRWKLKDKQLISNLSFVVAIEAIVVGNILMQFQGTSAYGSLYGGVNSVNSEIKIIEKLKEQDSSFFRVYNGSSSRGSVNLGMVEGYNGMGTFHSVYNYEIDDFKLWSHFAYTGSRDSWSMGYHEKRINLDTFLNVKYYLFNKTDTNIPFGTTKILELDDKVIYRNDNYIPLGLSFNTMQSAESIRYSDGYDNASSIGSYYGRVVKNEYLYTTTAILSDEDAKEILESYPSLKYNYSLSYINNFDDLEMYYIYPSNIQVEQARWRSKEEGGTYIDNINVGTYTKEKVTGLKWNSKLIVSDLETPIASEASERGGAFITIKQRMGENLHIYLYDKDNKLICSDFHLKHNFDKNSDHKYERGFYVDRPVYKIEIVVKDTMNEAKFLYKPDVVIEYYDTYISNINKLKETQFINVVSSTNKYEFDSNNSEDMVSVLTIPYDLGWKLKAYDENGEREVKIYKGQGGFVSFVNEKGNIHYSLEYYTPMLDYGAIGFSIGTMMFALMYYSFNVIKEDKQFIEENLFLH